MGRLKTHEERQRKRMIKNPLRSIPSAETKDQKPVELTEGQKLVKFLLEKTSGMARDYKNTIKYTGSVVSTSMAYAYQKAVVDVTQLLINEVYKEKESGKEIVTENQVIPGFESNGAS